MGSGDTDLCLSQHRRMVDLLCQERAGGVWVVSFWDGRPCVAERTMNYARECGIRVTVVPPEGRRYRYDLSAAYHSLPELPTDDRSNRRLKPK
jgi:hypothetical protein